jgi:tetratricopeptide (TPR) repeat protein
MKFCSLLIFVAAVLVALFFADGLCSGKASKDNDLLEQARHKYAAGEFDGAERDFREVIKRDPSNIYAQAFLGHALFRQAKYAESVKPYEKARQLEIEGSKLSSDQHRIIIDQLSMAYGISGQVSKARELLERSIQQDPEYPLNYYNLACVFAELGEKPKMLANLSLAFHHKDHVLKGERLPNPRTDLSFQKYIRDDDFVKLMKDMAHAQ